MRRQPCADEDTGRRASQTLAPGTGKTNGTISTSAFLEQCQCFSMFVAVFVTTDPPSIAVRRSSNSFFTYKGVHGIVSSNIARNKSTHFLTIKVRKWVLFDSNYTKN
jgi:hypothetical protein